MGRIELSSDALKKLGEQAEKQGVSVGDLLSELLDHSTSGLALELEPDEERKVALAAEAHYRALRRVKQEEEEAAAAKQAEKKKDGTSLLDWLNAL